MRLCAFVCVFHEINLCANKIVFIICRQHCTEEHEILQFTSYNHVIAEKNLNRKGFLLVSCSFSKSAKGYCKLLAQTVAENHCFFLGNKVYPST